jgi:hypothetical protein
MFKKKDGTEVDEAAETPARKVDKVDEVAHDAAYEDSWYRSLKALAGTLGIGRPDEDEAEPGPEA